MAISLQNLINVLNNETLTGSLSDPANSGTELRKITLDSNTPSTIRFLQLQNLVNVLCNSTIDGQLEDPANSDTELCNDTYNSNKPGHIHVLQNMYAIGQHIPNMVPAPISGM